MLIFFLIVIQIVVFTSLVFFLRNTLNRNVISATSHLEQLTAEYAKKEAEIKKLYDDAKRQAQEILESTKKDAEKQKDELLKSTQAEKDKILSNAHQDAEEIIQQAERSRQALLAEINQRIDEKAIQRASQLIAGSLPEDVRQEIHERWLDGLMSSSFAQLDRLHIPEGINEAKVITAFALTPPQREALQAKIKEKVGGQISFKEEVDPNIIAGLVVNMGSLVFDGSLRLKIQEVASAQQPG